MLNNPTTEAAALGCILLDENCLDDTTLKPGDFSIVSNADIFVRMLELRAQGQPVDMVTLSEGHSKPSYISSLTDGVPTSKNFKAYEAALLEMSKRRAVLEICEQYKIEAEANPEINDLIAGFEEGALSVNQGTFGRGFEALGEGMAPHVRRFDDLQEGNIPAGLKTGFGFIDRLTGGFQPGELVIVAARPGQGKTTLAMNFCTNIAKRREAVSFLSLEMNDWALRVRMICSIADVDSSKVRAVDLTPEEKTAYKRVAEMMASFPIHINDNSRTNLRTFKSQARRLVRKHGVKLLVIDYLQLMETGDRDESRRHAIDKISRELKVLASDLAVPIVVLSQLNRESDKDKRAPRISDLKESGAIEQDADIVILLYQKDPEDNKSDCIIAKNRGGAVGIGEFTFTKEYNKFEGFE